MTIFRKGAVVFLLFIGIFCFFNRAHAALLIKPSNSLGLVGYWSMDDGTGGVATDFSGKGNAGALTNTPTWVNGKYGKALSFAKASDQYVNLGNPTALQITGDLTISSWVKIASLPSTEGAAYQIVSKDKDTGGRAWAFDILRDTATTAILRFYINGGGANNEVDGTQNIALGNWYHVAATYSTSGVLTTYINGVQEAQDSTGNDTSISSATANVLIGRREYSGFEDPIDGSIDEVRVFNRALGATEVAALYTTGLTQVKNAARGLVEHYMFDEVSGNTVADRTGRGDDATLLPVPTSISRVQFRHSYPGGSGSALAFNSSVTSGNLIIVSFSGNGGSASSVTDNCSNTYTQATSGSVGSTASEIWYAYNVTGGTCTVTVAGSFSDFGMSIFEYSGASTGDPLETTHIDLQKKAGTPFSTAVDGMIFVHWANEVGGSDATGAGSGWSEIQHDTTHYDLQEENITATAGTYTPSVGGADQGSDVLLAAAFKGRNRATRTAGKYGGAVKLDGSDDYVDAGDITSLDGLSGFSVSAWVKINTDHNGVVVSKTTDSTDGWYLYSRLATDNKLVFGVDTASAGVVEATYTFGAGAPTGWNHLAGTYDGTNLRLYWNGALQDTQAQSGPLVDIASTLRVGLRGNGTLPFNGLVDDVRLYNRGLSGQEVSNLYNSLGEGAALLNTSKNNLLTAGLVGLWSFNGPDIVAATSTDRSGQGNDGTIVGGAPRKIGAIAQALGFDGSDDYVRIADVAVHRPTTVSISAWAKHNTLSGAQTILGKDKQTGQAYGLAVNVVNSGYLEFISYNTQWYTPKVPTSELTVGAWYHVVGTYDGTNMRLYLNGALRDTVALPSIDYTTPHELTIGRYYNNGVGANYFNGTLDDVRVYNRALTAAEVLQLYKQGD